MQKGKVNVIFPQNPKEEKESEIKEEEKWWCVGPLKKTVFPEKDFDAYCRNCSPEACGKQAYDKCTSRHKITPGGK